MSDLTTLQNNLNKLLSQALSISSDIEKGQAQTPLVNRINSVQSELEDPNFTIIVVSLEPASQLSALKWLCGQSFSVFNLSSHESLGLIEIELKNKGFSYEPQNGERREFSEWQDLLDAFNADSSTSLLESEALKLSVSGENLPKNLSILVPECIDSIETTPALYTQIIRRANLIAIAGSPWHQLSDKEAQLLASISEEMNYIWPLLTVDELQQNEPIPQQGWWNQSSHLNHISPLLLTTHVSPQLPDFLTNTTDALRHSLLFQQVASKMVSVSEALEREYELKLKQLKSKRNNEDRKRQASSGLSVDNLKNQSRLRSAITEKFSKISKSVQASCKKLELSGSVLMKDLDSFLESISIDDIEQQQRHKIIQFAINNRFEQDLRLFIKKSIVRELTTVFENSSCQTMELKQWLNKELGLNEQAKSDDYSNKSNFNSAWGDIEDYLSVDLKYQGELPKRNFLDRLSEGRRSAFFILMMATLLGYMGFNVRSSAWIGILIVPVFIGSIVYTFLSWKKQDALRIEKEIQKIRNETSNKAKRLMSDIFRESQNRIHTLLDEYKKVLIELSEKRMEDERNKLQDRDNKEKQRSQQRIDSIEMQIRQWDGYQLDVKNIIREFSAFQRQLSSYTEKLLG